MPSIENPQILFNEIPSGYPDPNKTVLLSTTTSFPTTPNPIDLETTPLNGSILVKVLSLSADPYMRGKMRPKEVDSYAPPYDLHKPIYGYGIGIILRSDHSKFTKGEYIVSLMMEHALYWIPSTSILNPPTLKKFVPEPGLPLSVYLGAAGMPGRTAYIAWNLYIDRGVRSLEQNAKQKTCFVSAGAGPVGSFVIQLAKRSGMKVIASAGSKKKLDLCTEMGADVVFNYKEEDTNKVLEKEGPIDVYWDNVGGPTLDAAFGNAAVHAKFIVCGFISQYNGEKGQEYKNIIAILNKRISIHGFLVFDHENPKSGSTSESAPDASRSSSITLCEEFDKVVPGWLARGEMKYKEDVSKGGLEEIGQALLQVQKGGNLGKKVVEVARVD